MSNGVLQRKKEDLELLGETRHALKLGLVQQGPGGLQVVGTRGRQGWDCT